MKLGIDAVGEAGGIVEAAVCYTGDVTDQNRGLYDLEYYLNFVRELESQGIHVLAIKGKAHPVADYLQVNYHVTRCAMINTLLPCHKSDLQPQTWPVFSSQMQLVCS